MKSTKKQARRRKIWLITLVMVLIGAALAWTLLLRQSSESNSQPVASLRVGIVGEYSSLSIIAQQKGFFRDNGLAVSIKNYVSGPPSVADVLANQVDIVTAADFVGVSNSFNHPDLKILATQARANSFFLVVRQDHGLHTAADLKGKRIGITRHTAGEFYLGQYLTFNHLTLSDVKLTDLPPNQLADNLANNSLDAIITFDPHITEAQKRLGPAVAVWPLQGTQKLSVMLYGTAALTQQQPEAIKRYLRSLAQADEYVLLHDLAARQLVGQYLHLDDAYMKTVWSHITFDLSLDQDLLITMEDQARWVIENKLTTATTVPDYLQTIYFDGLQAVKPEGITIIR